MSQSETDASAWRQRIIWPSRETWEELQGGAVLGFNAGPCAGSDAMYGLRPFATPAEAATAIAQLAKLRAKLHRQGKHKERRAIRLLIAALGGPGREEMSMAG